MNNEALVWGLIVVIVLVVLFWMWDQRQKSGFCGGVCGTYNTYSMSPNAHSEYDALKYMGSIPRYYQS